MFDQGARGLAAAVTLFFGYGAAALAVPPELPAVELRAQSVRPLTGVDDPSAMATWPLTEPGLYTLVAEADGASGPRHPVMALPLSASVGLIGTGMTLVAWRGLARRRPDTRHGWSPGSDQAARPARAC